MNALFRSAVTQVPRHVRTKATAAVAAPTRGSFKDFCTKTWTSEPGAYPIIAIVVFACFGCTGYMGYKMMYDKDVRVDPAKRNSVVRYWGK